MLHRGEGALPHLETARYCLVQKTKSHRRRMPTGEEFLAQLEQMWCGGQSQEQFREGLQPGLCLAQLKPM